MMVCWALLRVPLTPRPERPRLCAGAGALLGMISSCYVALYGQARILCVVARDHMLPPVLARIAPATGTPAIAAVVMGAATGSPLRASGRPEAVNAGTNSTRSTSCGSLAHSPDS